MVLKRGGSESACRVGVESARILDYNILNSHIQNRSFENYSYLIIPFDVLSRAKPKGSGSIR